MLRRVAVRGIAAVVSSCVAISSLQAVAAESTVNGSGDDGQGAAAKTKTPHANTTAPARAIAAAPSTPSSSSSSSIPAILVAALASTGEEPPEASAAAVQFGADVEYLSQAAWSYHAGPPPAAAVAPASTAQVAAILRAASLHGFAVIARAGGTALEGQTVPSGGVRSRAGDASPQSEPQPESLARATVILSMTRLNRVLRVSPEDLSCDVEPGVGWQELGGTLTAHGLLFPVDPGPGAQVGGHVSSSPETSALNGVCVRVCTQFSSSSLR